MTNSRLIYVLGPLNYVYFNISRARQILDLCFFVVEQPDAVQQQCVTDVHLRVLNLCKNTRKISNSIDSGYLSHMCISSVHTSCLAQHQGSRHADDEDVD